MRTTASLCEANLLYTGFFKYVKMEKTDLISILEMAILPTPTPPKCK